MRAMFSAIVTIALSMWISTSIYAADTIESFDVSALDVEMYVGGSGFGLEKSEQTLGASTVLGYGLLNRLSGYMAFGAETNTYLVEGDGGIAFGIFGTPLDTDHFDADLLADLSLDGGNMSELTATPGLELNFDLEPDQGLWGLYAQGEPTISGRETEESAASADPDAETEYEYVWTMNYTLGSYVTLGERHQILAEYYRAETRNPAEGEPGLEDQLIAVGYNVAVHDRLELVSDFAFHLPRDNEDFYWGITVGFIGTIQGPTAP
jgi:hypothetical protein